MDSPQLENGYTKIATEIMEALTKYRIPGEQMQCLICILRKTYGWNKKEDSIALSQFVDATGINMPNVCRALRGLIDKNIVIKKDNRAITKYLFNKKYKTWKPLSKKITVIKKDNLPLSKKTDTKDTITKDKKKIYKRKFLEFVFLNPDEHKKLIEQFGETIALEWIQRLNDYIGSKGKRYKSHYHTILNWSRKEKPEPQKKQVPIKELIT